MLCIFPGLLGEKIGVMSDYVHRPGGPVVNLEHYVLALALEFNSRLCGEMLTVFATPPKKKQKDQLLRAPIAA